MSQIHQTGCRHGKLQHGVAERTSENHLGAWNVFLRVLEVGEQMLVAPNDAWLFERRPQ
eukprot:SAG31_NODE_3266_length_4472_cov_4.101142_4_plen_59_part_00